MPITITIELVKKLLTARETSVSDVSLELERLEDCRTYNILKGGAGQSPPVLTGKSKQAVAEVFALVNAAVLNIGTLADLCGTKRDLFEEYQTARLKDPLDLEALYNSFANDVVEVPALPGSSSGFLSLTPGGQKASVSADNLQRVIEADVKMARETIDRIDSIWKSQITTVNTYEGRIAALLTRIAGNASETRTLERAKEAVREASTAINSNPLESDTAFTTTVEPLLVGVENRLAAAQQERTDVLRACNEAERKIRTLRPLTIKCDDLWLYVQQHVASPTEMRRADKTQIDNFRTSLTTIEADRNTATAKSLQSKLADWNVEVDAYLAIENAARASFEALQQQRIGLVARLSAFTGQAKSAHVYENPKLLPTALEAFRLLGPRFPTPLVEVAELVGLYEQRLHSLV